ncbi:hypothetical protein [Flavobacterium xinjiangense]|uniref:Tail specific protease N-terminal domain-containing protein n=1 Tax=Flavobacterium xinjiangense TaxID=178356 RepID=A0A1M7FIB1_9FLAO|nr:hypothetical protein [Flavobacterium xinjiangense]SHM03528.1 hypothetical protein SAMN05216269_102159 [Flavobacterium xinjiangense]
MRKIILIFSLLLYFTISFGTLIAQEKKTGSNDDLLKDSLYAVNKVKVLNYSLKQFDQLFFEFFDKKSDSQLVLTKSEFYNYTVQIAVFSDRLAALYPEQKQIAAENKKKWFAESYQDYLLSKASAKK